jgi:predicted phosphoribosyltransferase/alpha-beta hydrolase superfamily lysophospholipase
MIYRDRKDAGEKLAMALKEKGYENPVVLGIPRGGVPLAVEVARAIHGELGVVVARKLGAPWNPELAIGATTAIGVTYVNSAVAAEVGADEAYIEAEKQRQVQEAQRREELFDSSRRPKVEGRTVIVVDDGIATGATAIAAVRSIKAEGAKQVILAIPVGPPETVRQLRDEADEVVCLDENPGFWAVGQFYAEFNPVSDQEVRRTLDTFAAVATDAARRVEIRRDGVRLVGVLTTPSGSGTFPIVIFVHGLGSGKNSPRNLVIAERLVEAGVATLLFDLSGHGESSTDPREGVEAYVADLEAAFAWAAGQEGINKELIGIAGSSLGATVAIRALGEGKVSPKTMVLRAPPIEPEELRRVHVPSLVLIGSRDPLRADVQRGVAGSPELTLSMVEGASHLFEEPGTLEEALHRTVDWFSSRFFATVTGGI